MNRAARSVSILVMAASREFAGHGEQLLDLWNSAIRREFPKSRFLLLALQGYRLGKSPDFKVSPLYLGRGKIRFSGAPGLGQNTEQSPARS